MAKTPKAFRKRFKAKYGKTKKEMKREADLLKRTLYVSTKKRER